MPDANPAVLELLENLEALAQRRRTRKLDYFKPYPKQVEFLAGGAKYRERLLMAGNQQGKSECGAYETALHLTGEYPDGWTGRRYTKPVRAWAASESAQFARDIQQAKLCGTPGVDADFGTGLIPRTAFSAKPTLGRGVADSFDTIFVYHKTNGVVDGQSTLTFKSYEQGRTKFQGEPVDFIWCDEEPPAEIYSEAIARITATAGMIFVTFTPLQGMSTVVSRFLSEPSPDRTVVKMTIDDALHIAPERRQQIIDGYLPHERDARARGIPLLGEGKVFTTPVEWIIEDTIPFDDVPRHWTKLWGLDFGIGHPFAAALLAWDRDTDCLHVLHGIRMADAKPLQHAAAMKPIGADVPVAWPHDGTIREKGTGESVASFYKAQNLRMMPSHATWPDGGYSFEAGVLELQERMETGRFKVGKHLTQWIEEFDMYHRKDGQVVKEKDDLLSATRVATMMKRYARPVLLGGKRSTAGQHRVALDIDFDLS